MKDRQAIALSVGLGKKPSWMQSIVARTSLQDGPSLHRKDLGREWRHGFSIASWVCGEQMRPPSRARDIGTGGRPFVIMAPVTLGHANPCLSLSTSPGFIQVEPGACCQLSRQRSAWVAARCKMDAADHTNRSRSEYELNSATPFASTRSGVRGGEFGGVALLPSLTRV